MILLLTKTIIPYFELKIKRTVKCHEPLAEAQGLVPAVTRQSDGIQTGYRARQEAA